MYYDKTKVFFFIYNLNIIELRNFYKGRYHLDTY